MPVLYKPYHYHELTLDLYALKGQYGDLFRLGSIGQSEDGREIYMCSLGREEASIKILFNAAIHGREYMNSTILMKKMAYILSHWEERLPEGLRADMTYRELMQNVCFYFIPVVNPDGVSISQNGKDGIRTRYLKRFVAEPHAVWKSNARGVDLNRNFPVGWENASEECSNRAAYFRGVHPASESETRAMIKAITQIQHLMAVITYHSSGEEIYGHYSNQPNEIVRSQDCLVRTAAKVTGYPVVSERETKENGGLGEWCIQRRKVAHIAIETGIGDAPLQDSEFSIIWMQNQFIFEQIAINLYLQECK